MAAESGTRKWHCMRTPLAIYLQVATWHQRLSTAAEGRADEEGSAVEVQGNACVATTCNGSRQLLLKGAPRDRHHDVDPHLMHAGLSVDGSTRWWQ